MNGSIRTARKFPSDTPAVGLEQAFRNAKEHDERLRNEQSGRAQAAERLVENTRRQLSDLVGREEWKQLRRDLREIRSDAQRQLQPPAGLDAELGKVRLAQKRKARALLRRLAPNSEAVERLLTAHQQSMMELLEPSGPRIVPGHHLESNVAEWRRLSPLNSIAYPWHDLDPGTDPHRWLVFTPPYPGFDSGFIPVTSDSARVEGHHALEPAAGLVGNEHARMEIEDADSHDFASVDMFSAVMCWFEAPATGLVEVLVDAQNLDCHHYLETENEFGWSDSTTFQSNYLMLKLFHPSAPDPSYALMSRIEVKTDDDTTTSQRKLTRGQHYFAQLFSSGPVQAGEHVYISVGTRTFDKTGTNDVGILSDTHFRWFIRSIQARISP